MFMTPTLVLWDIDHTLIETGGVGTKVYAEAFQRVTGQPFGEMPALSGRTEPVIFREALAMHGVPDPGGQLFSRFAAEQARGYATHVGELRARGRALPGAADALRALAERGDAIQTIVTGNTRPSAEIKLRVFGLGSCLGWGIGAYGTDADDRPELVRIALRRAAKATGHQFGPSHAVVIGDTPNDVTAAREGGARIIAVATGQASVGELARAGAGTVIPDLTRTVELLKLIYGDRRG